jgi:hypothetical protein
MRNTWTLFAIVTFGILALTVIGLGAQSLRPTSETYSWSGELVGFDAGGRTMTVRTRVVGDQALAELPQFKAGDRIVLTWSGFDTYADAVSRAVRYDSSKKWNAPFMFPVEFVAYDRQYVTFKVQVPAASVEPLTPIKPGEWVTAISRHRPATEADAITTVHAYTASAARPSTT